LELLENFTREEIEKREKLYFYSVFMLHLAYGTAVVEVHHQPVRGGEGGSWTKC
jgi:hypothetical protein